MPRQERTKSGTGIYHVMLRGINRQDIFHDGANADSEYEYDSNGALTKDSNRGIKSITYDYRHLPYYIDMNQGRGKSRNITNDYTADGKKLSSRHRTYTSGNTVVTTTDLYIDGLMLRDGTPLLWRFDGGYVDLNANGAPTRWNYYITDHLGSTRMVVDSNDSIRETINYYPFGSEMRMAPPAQMSGDTSHPFRFTGKELDRQISLNMYDFGARLYDVAGVPMWTSVDPLCEKYYYVSPYAYCANNPVKFVDPDGRVVNLAAGGIGAIAGAGIYACVAYWEGKSSKEIWGAATEGAIVGGMAGLTMGASTAITTSSIAVDASISALSSGIGNATNQLISKGDINSNEVENSLVSGALSGTMGSVGGTLVNKCGKMAEGAIAAKAENTIANARNLAYSQAEQTGAKMGGKYAKQQVNKETSRIIANTKSSASSEIKTTKIITAGKNWSVQMGVGSITSKVSKCYDSAKEKVKSVFNMIF